MSTTTEDKILSWVSEALDLRHGTGGSTDGSKIPVPAADTGYFDILRILQEVRRRGDRVDELLALATQAKARAKRAQEGAKFEAEFAYDTATVQQSARRTRDFVTAKEKHAEAALDSFEARRAAHTAERLVSISAEAYEVISQVHWQLEGIRKDLRATLHALQFEASLER